MLKVSSCAKDKQSALFIRNLIVKLTDNSIVHSTHHFVRGFKVHKAATNDIQGKTIVSMWNEMSTFVISCW